MLHLYEKSRKLNNFITANTLDGIKKLFESELYPIVIARNIGLSLSNLPLIKV